MSKRERDKGKRGERRWAAWFKARGFRVKTTDETGSEGHDEEIGRDLELTDFEPSLFAQCKELRANCPSPRGMLERAQIAAVHFTEGSLFTRDIIIMRADVFDELAAKAAERSE